MMHDNTYLPFNRRDTFQRLLQLLLSLMEEDMLLEYISDDKQDGHPALDTSGIQVGFPGLCKAE